MTELFYWKEIERRARAAQALAMLHNRTDTDGINQANAILDELCLDRKGAERDKKPHAAATEPDPIAVPAGDKTSIGGLEPRRPALQSLIRPGCRLAGAPNKHIGGVNVGRPRMGDAGAGANLT